MLPKGQDPVAADRKAVRAASTEAINTVREAISARITELIRDRHRHPNPPLLLHLKRNKPLSAL